MAAFDKVNSGIAGIDQALDNIRMGDNVVWQLTHLEDFRCIVEPFVRQALKDGRDLVYIRFAEHIELVKPHPHITRYELNPHEGFEPFSVKVRSIITEHGRDAFYVFDCLSELQVAWSADLMMGNFFRVTCPYLFILDTVAYFPIIRGSHSQSAVNKIRDTTQLFIDVFSDDSKLFVHPLKVWNRQSPTMFAPHAVDLETQAAHPLTDSVEMSRFFTCADAANAGAPDENTDSWDRFFSMVQARQSAADLDEESRLRLSRMMCNMMMTRDEHMRSMVKEVFDISDYLIVRRRMVGTGLIGGKACGMLLARKIVEARLPQYRARLEPHDSFYIGTDVFYTYIVYNDAWATRIEQVNERGYGKAAAALRNSLLEGSFPEDVRNGFVRILDYFGQTPIIVRSSSFLEDGFGNAFAGKYESVFCPNTGSPEERLSDFEAAVRHVYASTMDRSALEYRARNGLDQREEQMALLVQRVSGSRVAEHLFMPTAAGVGYSHSAWHWMKDMDPEAGMLRLVMGLGTKAVDRTGHDFPRLASLDRPLATTARDTAEKHRFSQKYLEAIDLQDCKLREMPVLDVQNELSAAARKALFEHDREAESRLRERGRRQNVLFASCEGLVANREFTGMMASILHTLQDEYDTPVDIEYTINVGENGDFVVNLLQCRPLKALNNVSGIEVPQLEEQDVLFEIHDGSMGSSRSVAIDLVILVDPRSYYECPHIKKSRVAPLISTVNERIKKTGETCLLLSPGRIGTSSPELGVPIAFADMSEMSGICEIAFSDAGYSPELSYGSHMFQDLVEAEMFYGALLEEATKTPIYRPGALTNGVMRDTSDITADVLGELEDKDLEGIVAVFDTHATGLTLWHDAVANRSVCGIAHED